MNRLFSWLLLFPIGAFASTEGEVDPFSSVIFWFTVIFAFALLGRFLAQRFRQPGVLGELFMGIVLGNVCYFAGGKLIILLREGAAVFHIMKDLLAGISLPTAVMKEIPDAYYQREVLTVLQSPLGEEYSKIAYALDAFSRYGVLFLLFMVGLESSVDELKKTGRASLQVALLGVAAPMVLGYTVAFWALPSASYQTPLFIAATLTATSIGITAKVLKELKILHTSEAKTILGAAVIDDIIGLVILAMTSSIVLQGVFHASVMIHILLCSFLFFYIIIAVGPWFLRKIIPYFHFLEPWEAKLSLSFLFIMGFAWLASWIQLASIIGAFAAGLLMHDDFFDKRKAVEIKKLIAPWESILAPLFFMLIGMQVKIETFLQGKVIGLALLLLVAAVVGKLISGFGGRKRDDRWLIGIGMLPRGEVGLVFASIGKALNVIPDTFFSAIVLMMTLTTLLTPPLLKARYASTSAA